MSINIESVGKRFRSIETAISEAYSSLSWYLIISPKILILIFVMFIPFLGNIWVSFHDWDPIATEKPFIGFENYGQLLNDPIFWTSLKNTIGFSVAMSISVVPLGLGVALLLNQNLRGTKIYSTMIFTPVVTSLVVVSLIWSWLFNPHDGLLNIILSTLNLPTLQWLRDPNTALFSIYLMSLWKQIPFHMVIFLAGLQNIPKNYYEAAIVDGANRIQRFRYVTIPLLRPTIFFSVIIQMIFSFRMFTQVFVLTEGGPSNSSNTLVHYFFQRGFADFDFGYASTIAVVLFILVFTLTLAQERIWGGSSV